MGSTEESVRRSARVLTAFMLEAEANGFAMSFALDPAAFMATWQAQRVARASLARGYAPPRIADIPEGRASMHVAQIRMNPLFPMVYRGDPDFKLVELGKLIAMQHWVDTDVSDGVHGNGVEGAPEQDHVLKTCLPPEIVSSARTLWQQTPSGVSVHTLDNTFNIVGVNVDPASGQVHFMLGSGANLMLVREHEGRFILANGYHRAWLLRSRGVEMVPAVVMKVASPGEAVPPGMMQPEVIFGPHPPVVDDFLNDEMSASASVRSMMRTVKITAEVSVVPRLV